MKKIKYLVLFIVIIIIIILISYNYLITLNSKELEQNTELENSIPLDSEILEQNIELENNVPLDSEISESDSTEVINTILEEPNTKRSYYTYSLSGIISLEEENQERKEKILHEDNTHKLTFVDGKYQLKRDNYTIYYEAYEKNSNSTEVNLEITDNNENVYITYFFDVEENENIKSKPEVAYKINGINGKIKDAYAPLYGHAAAGIEQIILILMEDGTLKYVDIFEGVQTGNFYAYTCEKIGKVKNILSVDAREIMDGDTAGPGWIDFIIEKIDGNYYSWDHY